MRWKKNAAENFPLAILLLRFFAGLEQALGNSAEHRQIALQPLADRLGMPGSVFAPACTTSLDQRRVQCLEQGRVRQRGHEGALGVSAARIASITGVSGPSFGFAGGLVRW